MWRKLVTQVALGKFPEAVSLLDISSACSEKRKAKLYFKHLKNKEKIIRFCNLSLCYHIRLNKLLKRRELKAK